MIYLATPPKLSKVPDPPGGHTSVDTVVILYTTDDDARLVDMDRLSALGYKMIYIGVTTQETLMGAVGALYMHASLDQVVCVDERIPVPSKSSMSRIKSISIPGIVDNDDVSDPKKKQEKKNDISVASVSKETEEAVNRLFKDIDIEGDSEFDGFEFDMDTLAENDKENQQKEAGSKKLAAGPRSIMQQRMEERNKHAADTKNPYTAGIHADAAKLFDGHRELPPDMGGKMFEEEAARELYDKTGLTAAGLKLPDYTTEVALLIVMKVADKLREQKMDKDKFIDLFIGEISGGESVSKEDKKNFADMIGPHLDAIMELSEKTQTSRS